MATLPEILGLTSREWVQKCAHDAVAAPNAIAMYQRMFREGILAGGMEATCEAGRVEHDGPTTKFTLVLGDGLETESVILPQTSRSGRARTTLCVSSQVGCAMGCTFCETAQMGLMRNLTAAEIVLQWFAARFKFGARIDNMVFMGMGEPMENLDAVLQAIRVLTDHNGPAIASARIGLSTVGRTSGIAKLTELAIAPPFSRVGLAVSINAPNDEIRCHIMPINRAEPMAQLMSAMLAWQRATNHPVMIEYVLIPGVNDAMEHADELAAYLGTLRCAINVIPYNPRRNSPWSAPTDASVWQFVQRLQEHGRFVKRRRTLGRGIMAACGQLGNEQIRGRRRLTDLAISAGT